MSAASPTVHLVDASPYVFRAFFSLPDSITDPRGEPVHAVYGFAGFLLKLLDQEDPTHLAVAFDGSLTTSFRNEIYPEYKAQREPPPPELEAQLGACRDVARALGAATFVDDRYEADDILGALWRRARRDEHRVVVVTSDKDLAQLVDEETILFDFARDTRYDEAAVVEKFGVRPAQIPDYLGLAGDSVDNIPGVTGVGPKSAQALLAAFDALEDALDRLDEVAQLPVRGARSLARKLDEQREIALLSKRLATVALEAPYDVAPAELAWHGAHREQVEEVFDRLGFGTIRERIPRYRSQTSPDGGSNDTASSGE